MKLSLCATFALVLMLWNLGYSANSVVVESKTVAPNGSVTIGVYITNDITIETINIPLEIRSATGGAFIANTLSGMAQGRALTFLTTSVARDSVKTGGCYPAPADGPNFVTPDMIRFQSGGGMPLTSGSDGSPGSGTPSYTISLGVNCEEGTFIIDTLCFNSQRLFFDPTPGTPFVPGFTPGTVTVDPLAQACTCNDRPTDVNCDGVVNIVDVSIVSGVAFGGNPEPSACCHGASGTASLPPSREGRDF